MKETILSILDTLITKSALDAKDEVRLALLDFRERVNAIKEVMPNAKADTAFIRAELPAQKSNPPGGEDYDHSIHTNPDALAWAKFFKKTCTELDLQCDESWMHSWFANAMMAMHDWMMSNTVREEREKRIAAEAALESERKGWPHEQPLTDEPMDIQVILLNRQVVDATARAEKAEAACAEMRRLMEISHPAIVWDRARMYYTSNERNQGRCEWHHENCDRVNAALKSTTLGQGWLSPEEGERLREDQRLNREMLMACKYDIEKWDLEIEQLKSQNETAYQTIRDLMSSLVEIGKALGSPVETARSELAEIAGELRKDIKAAIEALEDKERLDWAFENKYALIGPYPVFPNKLLSRDDVDAARKETP